jgi:hypothetical protein
MNLIGYGRQILPLFLDRFNLIFLLFFKNNICWNFGYHCGCRLGRQVKSINVALFSPLYRSSLRISSHSSSLISTPFTLLVKWGNIWYGIILLTQSNVFFHFSDYKWIINIIEDRDVNFQEDEIWKSMINIFEEKLADKIIPYQILPHLTNKVNGVLTTSVVIGTDCIGNCKSTRSRPRWPLGKIYLRVRR